MTFKTDIQRRYFAKNFFMGSSIMLFSACVQYKISNPSMNNESIKKPKKLNIGDTIGLIAPASSFDQKGYELAVSNIESLGFKVKPGSNLFKKNGFLAGTDQERIDDIHEMFADKEVDGIWCIRGGYGVTRLLKDLDYSLIKKNPKVLIGYSDITALVHAIYLKTGIVGFHGPIAKSKFNNYNRSEIQNVLMNDKYHHKIPYLLSGENAIYQPKVIKKGIAKGRLTGGNLCLLSAMCGTPFHWDATDKLVFIEEIEEKPYRIDRMLTQLLEGSNLAKANGIILGVFKGCEKDGEDDNQSLMDVLHERLGNLGIPVFYGFSFGHISNICTIPIGIEASFDTSIPEIILHENAVV